MDMKDIEKMAKGANIDLGAIENMAKSAGFDTSKAGDLLGKLASTDASALKNVEEITSKMDPAQMAQIMGLLGTIDMKSLDINALAKQFGIPQDAVNQIMGMLKK